MPTLREFAYALYGVFRFARFDSGAMAWFGTDAGSCRRSFFAAVVVAPFYYAVLLVNYASDPGTIGALRFVAVETCAYVIHWVAYPLLMVQVCRMIDRENRLFVYITAQNWVAVPQNLIYLLAILLAQAGLVGIAAANTIGIVLFLVIAAYDWFVAKTALGIGTLAAVLLVGVGIFLNIFIRAFADMILLG